MAGLHISNAYQTTNDHKSKSPLHTMLLIIIGFGIVLLLIMLALAFGPSGVGFGVVVFIFSFAAVLHRYRFSMWALMSFVAMFCVWLSIKIDWNAKMDLAIAGVESGGGRLEVYDQRPDFPWGISSNRYNLSFYGVEKAITRKHIAHLEAFAPSSLHDLDLTNTGVTDDDLKIIGRLADIEYLSLENATFRSGKRILILPQNQITDTGLVHLRQLTKLRRIILSGTDITDDGLKILSTMPHLKCIYLRGMILKGSGIACLQSLKTLRTLMLDGSTISSVGYQELCKLPSLELLSLDNSDITDADLKRLAGITQLMDLHLHNTNVSDDAVKQFTVAHPKCRIQR